MTGVEPQPGLQRFSSHILAVAALATAAFGIAFHCRWFPLGVPGELESPRLDTWDLPIAPWVVMLPAVGVAIVMVAFVFWALQWIGTARRRTFVLSLACCVALGGTFQLLLEIAAPNGLQKWAVLHHGFRAAARLKFSDVPSVLQNHAKVIAELEPNHVSANPAGWIVLYRALLSFFDGHPRAAQAVWSLEPHEIAWALRQNFGGYTPFADQAAIAVVAFVSRFAAVAVGLPIAWLVNQRVGRAAALVACAMANLVPAMPLVAPAVDTVYPTFAALIVALSYYASQRRSWLAAGVAGVMVAIGMLFSLCFVVVAALCAVMVTLDALCGRRPTLASVATAVVGWLTTIVLVALIFDHRVWESWQINLAKNREFNSYCGCTYGAWVGVNLLELAVAMGIPVTVFLLARLLPLPPGEGRGEGTSSDNGTSLSQSHIAHPNPLPKGEGTALFAAWLAIVLLLDLSGTNLGEVSRLWLFLMPIGAALAVEWLDTANRRGRAVIASLLLLQAFACTLLARELVLLWLSAPRQIQDQYLGSPGGKWASYRRLNDEAFQRRRGSELTPPAGSEGR